MMQSLVELVGRPGVFNWLRFAGSYPQSGQTKFFCCSEQAGWRMVIIKKSVSFDIPRYFQHRMTRCLCFDHLTFKCLIIGQVFIVSLKDVLNQKHRCLLPTKLKMPNSSALVFLKGFWLQITMEGNVSVSLWITCSEIRAISWLWIH